MMSPHRPDKVFCLACKYHAAVGIMSVVKRPYADGVARSDKLLCLPVINYHGKLRVELFEHLKAVFAVKRQNDLAVGLAFEAVFCTQLLAELSEAVQLAVADYRVAVEAERLHAAFVKSHDRQAVKSRAPRRQAPATRVASGPRDTVRSKYALTD